MPLSGHGAFMVLGCAFMVFWGGGGYSFGLFEEVGFDLPLVVWGWLVCGWVEGGVGVGGASLSGGVLDSWGLSF